MTLPFRSALPLALLASLSGCISFGPKPPESLLTLTAAQVRAEGTTRTAAQSETVIVSLPTVPQELRVTRVPVRTGATELAYLKDAQWVEQPNALFGRLLTETIAASGRVVIDARQTTFEPGIVLTGQLQSFGIDADRTEAVIVYDAALAGPGSTVRTRRFEARAPIAEIDVEAAGPALNQVANQVAGEVAAWLNGG
ncbi:membrane integrity-associated transporter subunit PqiC [Allosphingosinicella flava]|uniref:Membrane integrity-associated transporter subunit PqiC n=1 Tax=Allosphingosinicella flava TaxID=2771430 RepID=A0A7T2GI41_9SPHN|nr:ABC-type transport auxiliary lipoprotein family protein [Sphingosinicella flava]QPQ54274.1 membrane integrity-associated transporter subunit PqiC [Sphingosinicella flava]